MDGDKSKSQRKLFLTHMLPVLIYAILIFYLSVIPLGNAPPGEEPPDEPEPSDGGGDGAGGAGGGTPVKSPADSQPAKSILYLKHNVPHFNEMVNVFLYLILGLLLFRVLKSYLPQIERFSSLEAVTDMNSALTIIAFILIIALIYSTVIELSQLSLISRVTDVNDIIYNTAGALLGAVAFFAREKYQTTKNSEIHK
jgi:VanZ family protein